LPEGLKFCAIHSFAAANVIQFKTSYLPLGSQHPIKQTTAPRPGIGIPGHRGAELPRSVIQFKMSDFTVVVATVPVAQECRPPLYSTQSNDPLHSLPDEAFFQEVAYRPLRSHL
jgi:hypothetical protein